MAAKIRMLKLLQEIRGFAEIANRRPPPRSPGLVLMQMRSHVIQATLPKRRLSVQMDVQDRLDISQPGENQSCEAGPCSGGNPSSLPNSTLPGWALRTIPLPHCLELRQCLPVNSFHSLSSRGRSHILHFEVSASDVK